MRGLGGSWVWYGALLTLQGPHTALVGVPLMVTGAGLLVATAPWGWRR